MMAKQVFDPKVNSFFFSNDFFTISHINLMVQRNGPFPSKNMIKSYHSTTLLGKAGNRLPIVKHFVNAFSLGLFIESKIQSLWDGYCFGMAFQAKEIHDNGERAIDKKLDDCWDFIYGSQVSTGTLQEQIRRMINTSLLNNLHELDELDKKLSNDELVILVLHHSDTHPDIAHAVVAYQCIYYRLQGWYEIKIYDPNHPRKRKSIFVDRAGSMYSSRRIRVKGYDTYTGFTIWNPSLFHLIP